MNVFRTVFKISSLQQNCHASISYFKLFLKYLLHVIRDLDCNDRLDLNPDKISLLRSRHLHEYIK